MLLFALAFLGGGCVFADDLPAVEAFDSGSDVTVSLRDVDPPPFVPLFFDAADEGALEGGSEVGDAGVVEADSSADGSEASDTAIDDGSSGG